MLNDALSEIADEKSNRIFREKYEELVSDQLSVIRELIPALLESPEAYEEADDGSAVVFWEFDEDTVIFPDFRSEGVVYVISDNKDKARSARKELVKKIGKVEEKYKGMGIEEVEIFSEEEFTKDMIAQKDKISSIEQGEEMNEFENEIYDQVKPISEAFGKNLIVDFEGAQNREYDLLLALSPANILHISVKDYSGREESPDKEELVKNPRGIATLLGSDMSFSAVRGIDNDDMDSFKKEATLRDDVEIHRKDDIHDEVLMFIERGMISGRFDFFRRMLNHVV